MFACLELREERAVGIFHRLLNILTEQKVRSHIRAVCGAEFLTIEAAVGKRGIDWQEVEAHAGRLAGRMLLPEGCCPPPECRVRPFRAVRFDRLVLQRTACELINRTRMPMYRRVLGVVDERGECADFLYGLLHYYTAVKVLTGAPAVYERAAQEMMERLGAPVFIGEDPRCFAECVLILAPEWPEALSARPGCPVLSGEAGVAGQGGCDFFSRLQTEPPPDVLAAVPRGIDPHLFAGALYELCGVQAVEPVAERLLYNGRRATLTEAVEIVSRRAGV